MSNKINDEIIKVIEEVGETKGQNSMGCSESYYNKYYMVKKFAEEEKIKLDEMSKSELETLLKLAEFASDVFY